MSDIVPIFIENWSENDFPQIQQLMKLEVPIWVDAMDVQKLNDTDQFLQHVTDNKIQILSSDVDDKEDKRFIVFQEAKRTGYRQILFLEELVQEEIVKLSDFLKRSQTKPLALHVLCHQEEDTSGFLARALSLDGFDLRCLRGAAIVYPVDLVSQIPLNKGKSFPADRLLIKLLLQPIDLYIHSSPTKRHKKKSSSFLQKSAHFFVDLIFLALSSFRQKSRPFHGALSVAMGVFVACSPFYGLQTFLIFACCFVLRLNFIKAFLGSQISWPPTYAFIVLFQLWVGSTLLGQPIEMGESLYQTASQQWPAWFLGAFIVGGSLALLSGALWYVLERALGAPEKALRVFREEAHNAIS